MSINSDQQIMPSLNPAGGQSLFAIHASLIQNIPSLDSLESMRVQEFATLPFKPLRSTTKDPKYFLNWRWGIGLAVAASLLLFINLKPQDDYAIKGTSHISIVQERSGVRSIFGREDTLQEGDKANAEILVSENTIAFMGVINSKGKMLSSHTDILQNSLKISAGQKSYFPIAVELIGETEGETMIIVTCREELFEREFADQSKFVTIFHNVGHEQEAFKRSLPFCHLKFTVLRH
jgi:hypothetical protein